MTADRLLHCLIAAVLVTSVVCGREPELHVRGGLPNLASRTGGEFRVAYLGGSITAAANGWRSLTTTLLGQRFPGLTIQEISAGLPGTGSNLGACRLSQDVLRHRPDLLFVEFAVNDTIAPPERIERTMEGIVRQTWHANPHTDICFVYTVSTPGLAELQAGNFPVAAQAMERVAAHYDIPSLHFGIEVARLIASRELVFKAPDAPADKRTFSIDGVHPTAAGHQVYLAAIERALPVLIQTSKTAPHTLPPPLHIDNWEGAGMRQLDEVNRQGKWLPVPLDDANLRGATKHLLPPLWRTATPGDSIEFEFTGRIFGLLGIAAPDSGSFRVKVDDLPPLEATLFDAFVSPTFCRAREWFYPGTLLPGRHHVRVEFIEAVPEKFAIKAKAGKPVTEQAPYAQNRLTLGGVLVVASPEQ